MLSLLFSAWVSISRPWGSGAYDLDQVSLLMPSAGDACRGSNFPSLIRKALAAAGYPQVEVLTWNVKGLERDHALPLRPEMVWQALFGLFYGDFSCCLPCRPGL